MSGGWLWPAKGAETLDGAVGSDTPILGVIGTATGGSPHGLPLEWGNLSLNFGS